MDNKKTTQRISLGCFFSRVGYTVDTMLGDSMKHIQLLVCVVVAVFLSSCSTGSVKSIPVTDYPQSLKDFYATESLQTREQAHFMVKVLSYIQLEKDNLVYTAYDIVVAPKTTLSVSKISVQVTPDYAVHDQLKPFFTDKSGLKWKLYAVRPGDVTEPFQNLDYAKVVSEPYGALRFRGYLVDGGEVNYEALGVSQSDMKLALSQLQVTITVDKTKEIFLFQLGALMDTYMIDDVPAEILANNSIVRGIVGNSLVVRWGEYLGN